MLPAVLIFAVTYLLMAGSRLPYVRVDRPAAALCGAVAMVVAGVLSFDEALAAIDLTVITLLVGMMIVAAYLQEAHFFRFAAWWVLTRTRTAQRLVWALVFVSGGLSALLLNDTICLMFTPLVLAVVVEAQLPHLPYLLALASATNIGGVASFTGNPQNMIIGQAAAGDPSYLQYLLVGVPIALACMAIDAWLITWLFRKELPRGPLPERHSPRPYLDRALTFKATLALAGFVVASSLGVSMAGAAVAAAAGLILMAGVPPRPALARVDWSLILFFAGLFVVVSGFARSGAMDDAFARLEPVLAQPGLLAVAAFVGLTIVGSNLVSNVPFVLLAVAWIPALPAPSEAYTLLAIASTLAGNLTIFGSVANVIVLESAGPRGEISFLRFFRFGLVVTALTTVAAIGLWWLLAPLALG